MSRIRDLADAVVGLLNSEPFSQRCTAELAYVPIVELEKLREKILVYVVPSAVEGEDAAKGVTRKDYAVDIGIHQHCQPNNLELIGQLLEFVEELENYMKQMRVTIDGQPFQCIKRSVDPLFVPEHLIEYSTFTSVITLQFRTHR